MKTRDCLQSFLHSISIRINIMSMLRVRLSDVEAMSAEQKNQTFSELLARGNQPNGELGDIGRRIAAFERVYEISSDKMQQEVEGGSRSETAEICHWLMLIELRNRVQRRSR